jgi:hypothetical protein
MPTKSLTARTPHSTLNGAPPCNAVHVCPHCSEYMVRVRRRTFDRVLSLVWPVYRFRCYNILCQWEGIRASQRAMAKAPVAG